MGQSHAAPYMDFCRNGDYCRAGDFCVQKIKRRRRKHGRIPFDLYRHPNADQCIYSCGHPCSFPQTSGQRQIQHTGVSVSFLLVSALPDAGAGA